MPVDVVIPPGREPHFGKFIHLNMLVMTGGPERTEDEFCQLLEALGFQLVREANSDSPYQHCGSRSSLIRGGHQSCSVGS